MWHGVSVIGKPTGELITLTKLKQRLRIDHNDDDDLLGDLLKQAIARVDGPSGIGVAMMKQTWRKSLDCFPAHILLPGAPVKQVTKISYVDAAGVTQEIQPTAYRCDVTSEPARVEAAYGTFWPSTRDIIGAVSVEYELGEDDAAAVPPDLISAVCMVVAHWYQTGGAVADGNLNEVPLGAQWILDEHSRGHVAA